MISEKRKKRTENMMIYLKEYKEKNQISPTVREICGACDIPSTASASSIIEELKRNGYITASKSIPRSFIITQAGEMYIKDILEKEENKEEII